jgi:protein involved in polysaccharide export with SLBB domain
MSRRALGALFVGLVLGAQVVGAQAGRPTDPTRDLESRASLEEQARVAESQNHTAEAWLVRSRLKSGDFQEGDRVVVTLLGTVPLNDTLMVRSGKVLSIPHMGDLPLDGVLRSELGARVSSHVAKYLRDSSARVTPLVRLAVLGQVRSPGFYYTSADVLLSDVVMRAGGPTGDADLGKMTIRRGGETIWAPSDTRTAITEGLSLDRLNLRAGDEVYVAEQSHFNWMQALQIGLGLAGLAAALFFRH